ncbi:MAG: hypothetical protein IPI31_15315 [Bacteroidetes bacterium]|nr:hypothetical protein [Bacteroidota bacterium]
MKRLMIIAAVLFVSNMNAQSMRMDPSVFATEMNNKQFGITPTTTSTQITFIDQSSHTDAGYATESANPKVNIAIVDNSDNSTSNIVVQEDLVAGKKGEGRNLFIKFYRKLFGN